MTTIGGGDGLEVDLLTIGARIAAIRVPLADGSRRDVVLGLADRAAYSSDRDYRGATVGRYANRIGGAAFELDGRTHRLVANDRGNTLHGGPSGFDARTWRLDDRGPRHAEMSLVSEEGDQGFPGTVSVRARFDVDGPELRTSYVATTDAPTHVALSSHAYFNLAGGGPTDDHRLTVHADHYLPVDATGLPTGELRAVVGSVFELDAARVGDVVAAGDPQVRAAAGLDHNFVLRGEGSRRAAVLEAAGLRLEVETDQPGLQVFTGAGLLDGIALEPQHFPDSPHHPEWPSTVLRPGEVYHWSSVVRVLPAPPSLSGG